MTLSVDEKKAMCDIPIVENQNTEFKASFNTGVIESLVAFANTGGGTVYVGC